MRAAGLESIDHTVQLTHIWINDLDSRLGWENKHRSYRLLRTVLQALRDWLPVNEAAGLGAQLPELLRGVYYEHWRPATTPVKHRKKAEFLARIADAFRNDPMPLRQFSNFCPIRSQPLKSRMCGMSCRQISGFFGRFLRKLPGGLLQKEFKAQHLVNFWWLRACRSDRV
jgi:uncharacterized protein (DUF2267 family)